MTELQPTPPDSAWMLISGLGRVCRVIHSQTLWGNAVARVWLPDDNSVVEISVERLAPLDTSSTGTPEGLMYVTAAARVADTLTQDMLLAPIESSVIPLPHQLRVLARAIAGDRIRFLLADEVGLGKTIEAGLIMRELKLRGLVKRTLVVAPKGIVPQWIAEMLTHFNESFHLINAEDYKTLKRVAEVQDFRSNASSAAIAGGRNKPPRQTRPVATQTPFRMFDQMVVPMDSVKPAEGRNGAAARERFDDLISAGWDLIIVDEAHRLGGSTDQVARFKLGQGLADAAPYFLLLSATPHQGKTDAFQRLVSLIDAEAFPDLASVSRERVQPYIIRTEKRRAIDALGRPLFKPRRTQLVPVSWEERHCDQQLLYDAVTEYVREGYNQALREKRNYVGFLMILMQRLVVSSTSAIRTTLERRLEALAAPQDQQTLFPPTSEDDWADLDGQEQIDTLLSSHLKALKNERAQVKLLLDAAAQCEQSGTDAKAESLLDWLYRLQSEESDPELKVLVFTEFVPTQEMLRRFLVDRGFSVVCLNGSMDMEERRKVQRAFADNVRILLSTDAGGEGLNLQFCHVVVNYDIPWNPMRLEQRIGRVDRIGQTHTVRAINLVFEESVEYRVREVLEEKLAIIFEELGIDKTGDVLDSAQAGAMFDEVYVEAILNPDKVEDSVQSMVARLREEARETRESASILGISETPDPGEAQRLMDHPLSFWVERMTVNYLRAYGGSVERKGAVWNFVWPDGEAFENCIFTAKEVQKLPTARHLTLEDPKVRALATNLPRFAPTQPVPIVSFPELSDEIQGVWSLWRISIVAADSSRERIMPLFMADDGRIFVPTARHVWDQLLSSTPVVYSTLSPQESQRVFVQAHKAAEEYGQSIYEGLVQEQSAAAVRKREKANYAFSARRNSLERIGLAQVRNHRLNLLAEEERAFQEQLDENFRVYPELVPLLIMRVERGA